MEASPTYLSIAAARSRPITMAESRLIEVPAAIAGLFPDGGIRRGSTVGIKPAGGGSSLALALAGAVTAGGGWAAAVGMPYLGVVAAAELGTRLDRLALIPRPGEQWPAVVAALVDGVDILLLRPPPRPRATDARRLVARVRERGTVMLILGPWPETPDLRLEVDRSSWAGLGAGYGHLRTREVEVCVSGRRVGSRERRKAIRLPGPDGALMGPEDSRVGPEDSRVAVVAALVG